FFGHAYLAARERDDPRFILGSMIPDFVGMIAARVSAIRDPTVEAGVAHHHEVDTAFHGAPMFLSLMGEAQDYLEARGLAHGAAMAVGHVGVELILDGWLSGHGHRHDAFCAAISAAREDMVEWRSPDYGHRWRLLCDRLIDGTLPYAYLEPSFIASRLELILSTRPRLALRGDDRTLVEAWATHAGPRIHSHATALMVEVVDRLTAARQLAETTTRVQE
ncbi:MAG: hypothetical protein ACPHRO_04420, partial [Nannocystaceae bacterium]